jgi:spore coat protein A, manganese oxidase
MQLAAILPGLSGAFRPLPGQIALGSVNAYLLQTMTWGPSAACSIANRASMDGLTQMAGISRRELIGYGLLTGTTVALPWTAGAGAMAAESDVKLRKYVQPLPVPGRGIVIASPVGTNRFAFTQRQIRRQLHPQLPATPFWAYDDGSGLGGQAGSFGMAVVARSGTPVRASFTNKLPERYPAWIPVDRRLTAKPDRRVRTMTHLHGGFVAADSDGSPAVDLDGFGHGQTQHVHYTNQEPQMPASLLWFHDHAFGATRLNVLAGLAAAYILRDQHDTGAEPNPSGIPGGSYEIPLVIQDRQFNSDGTFRYPVSDIPGVTWIGEYFGDVMLVNGKVWPFLDVEPRLYRFRILNGCNSRILNLHMSGAQLWQIGAEGGMWDRPVPVERLVLAPAERADLIADFRHAAGERLVLTNNPPRLPVSTPAPPLSAVMQMRVGTSVTRPGPATVPSSLPGRRADLPAPHRRRFITLNEIAAGSASWTLNLDGLDFETLAATGTARERPKVGTVEDWLFINMTGDTHPMHTHLVTHQVIGRTPFNVDAYQAKYGGPNGVRGGIDPRPFATGPMEPPDPTERGFKDTTKANPGYFTTIRARFDLPTGVTAPQTYVYHCHIVEHEDNDMMLPFVVEP